LPARFFATTQPQALTILKTILLIEDQPDMRENIATILEMEEYAVLTADNGFAGLALACEEKPDLILCDVMMPDLDGYGVLEKLRQDRTVAGTPFIFLTAKGEKRDVRAGMNLGADDYLTKPVTATDLLAAINARFHREQSRPAAAFRPDFASAEPLESLGLTPREAEVLLWVAQGKSNAEISVILGAAESTVKKHLQSIFEKLGVDNRNAAALRAMEKLA
jgi:DNA-binding NarL/FixJ family response regulator